MKRWIGFGLAAIILMWLLGGCQENYTWFQRMTIIVDTPQGVVSASNVVKTGWTKNDSLGAANGAAWRYGPRGEAVVVPLGGGRYLFALTMKDEYAGNIAGQVLFKQDGRVWGTDKFKAITAHKGALDVSFSRAPMLVTFDDITKPETVKLVDPANLSATFGEGYALKSISVEIADEKVTEGAVGKVLGWLKERNPIFLENWKDFPADHPLRNISKFSFKTGT